MNKCSQFQNIWGNFENYAELQPLWTDVHSRFVWLFLKCIYFRQLDLNDIYEISEVNKN